MRADAVPRTVTVPLQPEHAAGARPKTGRNLSDDLKRVEVDHGHAVAPAQRRVRPRTIGLHQHGVRSEIKSRDLGSRRGVQHHETAACTVGDEDPPSIRCELQTVGVRQIQIESLYDLFHANIDDGDATVVARRRPDFPPSGDRSIPSGNLPPTGIAVTLQLGGPAAASSTTARCWNRDSL